MSGIDRRKIIALSCWVLSLALFAASLAISLMGASMDSADSGSPVLLLIVLSFSTVGLMLVLKVPRNRMGWIFSLGGLLASAWLTSQSYLEAAKLNGWPGIPYVAWFNLAVYFPMILCLVALPLLLFPDGEVPSPGWRWVWWPIFGVASLAVLVTTIQPEYTDEVPGQGVYRVDNPFGTDALNGLLESTAMALLGALLLALALIGPAAAMVYRFRRSRGVERLQLKWLAFSATLSGVGLAVVYNAQGWVSESSPWLQVLTAVALIGVLGIPITAGVAITRYHLYDVDRLISRTIAYGLLVALLGVVYVLAVSVLGGLAFEGRVQVALSTLAVAALFNPLRRQLQHLLDRRFSRSVYAPQQVIDDFSHLIRDEIDVDNLVEDLLGVVDGTVAPSKRGVWIREPAT